MDKQRFEAIYVRQSIERDESKSIEAQIEKGNYANIPSVGI